VLAVEGHAQWPPLHEAPVGQVIPQPPQFAVSVIVFTHFDEQSTRGLVQVHAPVMQLAPAGQTLPQ
jgi:hypothetical protein